MFSDGIILSLSLVHIVPDSINDLNIIDYPLGGCAKFVRTFSNPTHLSLPTLFAYFAEKIGKRGASLRPFAPVQLSLLGTDHGGESIYWCYLPDKYIDRQNIKWEYLECPKYIMYTKIQADEFFGLHTDTGCQYDTRMNKYSKYTVLTYLNDDYEGGNTVFYNDNFKKTCEIKPKLNRTLIFDIDLYHQGCEVLKGSKYWIGSELVCGKVNLMEKKQAKGFVSSYKNHIFHHDHKLVLIFPLYMDLQNKLFHYGNLF